MDTLQPGVPVYNESFGGGTAAQMVDQLYSPGGVIDRVNAHPDADVVWLSAGGNDMLLGLAGGGFYVNNSNNAAVYAAIQSNVQTIADAILTQRPDLQVVIMGYDYLNIWDQVSGSAGDNIRANLGVIKSGNTIVDALQNQSVNDGFKAAEQGKIAIADANRRVAEVYNFGLNNTYGGYNGYFGNFPAGSTYPPELYPALPTPSNRMNPGDPIHLNNLGYTTLALHAEQEFLLSAFSAASLGMSTSTLAFGNQRIGTSSSQSVTASNTGPSFTKVKDLYFSAATGAFGGGDLSFNPLFQDPTLGSDTATVSYAFAPAAHGAAIQTIAVTSDSGSPNVMLTGQGVGPTYASVSSLMFDPLATGTTDSTDLGVSNATADGELGNLTNLSLLSYTITGPDAARFSLSGFIPSSVIAAGGAEDLAVQFDATGAASGNYAAVLTLTTDQGAAFGGAGQQFSITLGAQVLTPAVADAGGSYSVAEGGTVLLDAVASSGDITSFAWDLDNNGTFETPGQTAIYSAGEEGAYTVGLQVAGPLGTSVDYATVNVMNVAPTAGIAGPATALRGETQTFTLTASDSPVDTAAGFTFSIDWGDGSPVQVVTGPSPTQVTHMFDAAASLSVNVTATDQHSATGAAASQPMNVDAVQLRPNAQNPSLVDLVWGGTSGADRVDFTQLSGTSIRVQETLLHGQAASTVLDLSGVTGRVLANAYTDNDQLDASRLVTTQATLDGGDGNDTLYGGSAGDVLIGGTDGGEGQQGSNVIIAGNGDNTIYGNGPTARKGATGGDNLIVGGTGHDTIYGNFGTNPTGDGGEGGQNLIIGGGGADTIYASQIVDGAEGGHGSILVSGSTTLDQAALMSVLSEWTSTHVLADKIANISGTGSGPRNNGNDFLQVGITVFDDSDADTLFSDSEGDENWLLTTLSDDTANRVKPSDVETDLS